MWVARPLGADFPPQPWVTARQQGEPWVGAAWPQTHHLWELDVSEAGDEGLAQARQVLQQTLVALFYQFVFLLYRL